MKNYVNSFFNSMKMSWIKKLANEEVAVWKNIALYHVSKTGLRIDLFNCNCSLKEMNAECIRTIDKLPMFYSSMIKSWFSTKPVVYKHNIDDPRAEIIWNNNAIQLNGKTLFISVVVLEAGLGLEAGLEAGFGRPWPWPCTRKLCSRPWPWPRVKSPR